MKWLVSVLVAPWLRSPRATWILTFLATCALFAGLALVVPMASGWLAGHWYVGLGIVLAGVLLAFAVALSAKGPEGLATLAVGLALFGYASAAGASTLCIAAALAIFSG